MVQKKYTEEGRRKASISLYSQLADTPEIQHALEVSQLQSEAGRAHKHTHAHTHRHAHCLILSVLSQVNYRPKRMVKGAPPSLYSQLADTVELQQAREMTELQSEVRVTHALWDLHELHEVARDRKKINITVLIYYIIFYES